MRTQYTYIEFVHKIAGHWSCVNRKYRDELGRCEFYMPWRQWVFRPAAKTEFSADCLADVIHFLGQLNGDIDAVRRGTMEVGHSV